MDDPFYQAPLASTSGLRRAGGKYSRIHLRCYLLDDLPGIFFGLQEGWQVEGRQARYRGGDFFSTQMGSSFRSSY